MKPTNIKEANLKKIIALANGDVENCIQGTQLIALDTLIQKKGDTIQNDNHLNGLKCILLPNGQYLAFKKVSFAKNSFLYMTRTYLMEELPPTEYNPEKVGISPETIQLNKKLEIVKIDSDYKFETKDKEIVTTNGYGFYIEGKGYVAYDNDTTPYTPLGGTASLEKIISDGGFLTYKGMKFLNPINEIGVQRITCL